MTTALAKRPAAKVGKRFPKPSEMTTAALKEHVATGTGVCVCAYKSRHAWSPRAGVQTGVQTGMQT